MWRGYSTLIADLLYQDLAPGEYLFHEGDPAIGVCLVLEGAVEIVKTAQDRERVLTCFHPGDYLGEIAVLDGQGRSTDARARDAVSVAWIPAAEVLEVLDTEPVALTLHLFQNVLSHLRKTNDLFVQEVVRKEKVSLVGEMASSLMHDLRNPLSVIQLSADFVKMIHSDNDTIQSCDRIRLQCDRVVVMARELLECSRGETTLHLERTDTSALVRQFVSFCEGSIASSLLQVEIENDPAEIEVDSMRVLRLLQNLVSNAKDALNSRPDGHIDVGAWVRDSILYLSVRDNGPGIPAEIKDKIFEPFVTHGKSGGTGLGLAIVSSVVKAHRGKISVETQAGQGTEFLVRLPQDAAAPAVE